VARCMSDVTSSRLRERGGRRWRTRAAIQTTIHEPLVTASQQSPPVCDRHQRHAPTTRSSAKSCAGWRRATVPVERAHLAVVPPVAVASAGGNVTAEPSVFPCRGSVAEGTPFQLTATFRPGTAGLLPLRLVSVAAFDCAPALQFRRNLNATSAGLPTSTPSGYLQSGAPCLDHGERQSATYQRKDERRVAGDGSICAGGTVTCCRIGSAVTIPDQGEPLTGIAIRRRPVGFHPAEA